MKKVIMTRGETKAFEAYGKEIAVIQKKAKKAGVKLPRKMGKAQFLTVFRMEKETGKISGREIARMQMAPSFISPSGAKIKPFPFSVKQLNTKYKIYIEQYEVITKRLEKKGLTMAEPMLTKGQFAATFRGRWVTQQDIIARGEKPKDIIKQIVESQAYQTTSTAHAKAVQKAIKGEAQAQKERAISEGRTLSEEELIKIPTLEEIKVKGVKEALKPINDQLKAQHPEWTSNQRGMWITENIFGGSP